MKNNNEGERRVMRSNVNVVEREVLNGMVAPELRVKEARILASQEVSTQKVVYINRESEKVESTMTSAPMIPMRDEVRIVEREEPIPADAKKKFKLIQPSKWDRGAWLRGVKRGDIIAIRSWSLGPLESVIVVSYCTPTMVVSICGKKFDKNDGISNDGKRLMLYPLNDKSRYLLVRKVRKAHGL